MLSRLILNFQIIEKINLIHISEQRNAFNISNNGKVINRENNPYNYGMTNQQTLFTYGIILILFYLFNFMFCFINDN